MPETMWTFHTRDWTVKAVIADSMYADTSFDETGETADKIASGEWRAFDTTVKVYFRGQLIGEDALGESIYADPREFFTAHRDSDPLNRNCSVMRAARGDSSAICHYFPDMVREAIRNARRNIAERPKLRPTPDLREALSNA